MKQAKHFAIFFRTYKSKICNKRLLKRRITPLLSLFLIFLIIPVPKIKAPCSTVIEAANGTLLGAHIAPDGQWRFPPLEKVPEKFKSSLIHFEDQYFHYHPGVNPISVIRAIKQNITNGCVISGASTLTMQTVRLARNGQPRTMKEKLLEFILALRLEWASSKEDILAQYASHAPFGGNVVGLSAAAWRYYGCAPDRLSWGEAATLAVLPNAPSLVYPGKNSPLLRKKRNRLLKKLLYNDVIDSLTCHLACLEPLPGPPRRMPQLAPHLLSLVKKSHPQQRVQTTINTSLQIRAKQILKSHHLQLEQNQIHNGAVLVLDIKTGNTLVYLGNTGRFFNKGNGNQVDLIQASRSTGSILKPFLFSKMLDQGIILPKTLVTDVPLILSGYSPKNFNLAYDGAVPADQALARSLNIPAVLMLQKFGYERFHQFLRDMGFSTFRKPPDHYGLSLILGGGEATLWELCGIYASMARTLSHYNQDQRYFPEDFHSPLFIPSTDNASSKGQKTPPLLSAGAIWQTFKALLEVRRPNGRNGWHTFSSASPIAWKTGTSFGFRDAWAIGITSRYVVGVWIGNADGEGRPGLTGVTAAAPVLFDICDQLPKGDWFKKPYSSLTPIEICRESGYRASLICPHKDTIWVSPKGLHTKACPYHKMVHLNQDSRFQVTSHCMPPSQMKHVPWFILPPTKEWYYKRKHPFYKTLPPFMAGCKGNQDRNPMEFIYPRGTTRVFVPTELNGKAGKVVFEVAHRNSQAALYWHLDNTFLGTTEGFHQMAMNPEPGSHLVSVVDKEGNILSKRFDILQKK